MTRKMRVKNDNTRNDGSRDDQIIALLNKLGERLIRTEKERIAIKGTIQRYDDLFASLEDRASNSEKVFLNMQGKLSRIEETKKSLQLRQLRVEEKQKIQEEKLERAEALSKKIEDTLAYQDRMTRRLESVIKDKARLIRKLESIEQTVLDTRDTLNTQSEMLLSVQKSGLPVDTRKAEKEPSAHEWNRPFYLQVAGVAALVVLAIFSAWAISRMPVPVQDDLTEATSIEKMAQGDIVPQQPAFPKSTAIENSTEPADTIFNMSDEELLERFSEDPDALAAQLNGLEPSVSSVPGSDLDTPIEESTAAEKVSFTPPADKEAVDTFDVEAFVNAQKTGKTLADRIKPDANLPPVIKDIETKAFEGIPEAQHDLAAIYTAGHGGVTADYEKASLWFTEAALQGISNASYNLGVLYHQGLGVEKDINKAVGWYRAAAEKGHPEAQYNLGIAHIEGIGTTYNPRLAAMFFEKAAQGGIKEAAYNLALVHENGLLGEQNLREALFWYKYASEQGSKEAATALKQLSEGMGMGESDVETLYKDMLKGHDIEENKQAQKHGAIEKTAPPKRAEASQNTATKTAAVKPSRSRADQPEVVVSAAAPDMNKVGSKIVLVSQVQDQLMKAGLFPGPADGVESELTKDSVRTYQSQNDLPQDGRITDALLIHMMANDIASDDTAIAHTETPAEKDIAPGSLMPDDMIVPGDFGSRAE